FSTESHTGSIVVRVQSFSSWSQSLPTHPTGPKSSLGSSRSCTAQRVDDAGQEVEVTLQLAGGRAHAQVQTAGQHVQTSERSGSGGVGALAGSELTPALGSTAIGTATSRGTRLGAHAAYSVAQVAENLRKAAVFALVAMLASMAYATPCTDICNAQCTIQKQTCSFAEIFGNLCDTVGGVCAQSCAAACSCADSCAAQCGGEFATCKSADSSAAGPFGGVGALAGSELTPALGSAAIGTATSRGTRLGAHAAYSVAQVAENLRKAAGLLLDGALGVTDVSAGGCVGHGGQHGDKSEDCERVHG
ncbi:hypothetical protein EGW08_020256, partial [Elysia chlorotica]